VSSSGRLTAGARRGRGRGGASGLGSGARPAGLSRVVVVLIASGGWRLKGEVAQRRPILEATSRATGVHSLQRAHLRRATPAHVVHTRCASKDS